MGVIRHFYNQSSTTWVVELLGDVHFPDYSDKKKATIDPGACATVEFTTQANKDCGRAYVKGKWYACRGLGWITATDGDDRISIKFAVGGPRRHMQAIFLCDDNRDLDPHTYRDWGVALNRMRYEPRADGREVRGDITFLDVAGSARGCTIM